MTDAGEVEVEGGVVRYRVVGTGEPALVLTHGGPGAGSLYLKPLEALGQGRSVVVYDQLGCGASDRPQDPTLWRIERFVDELETLRAHLGLDRFDLLGHSWGGMLAIDYALAHPARVRALVLASTLASARLLREEMERLLLGFPDDVQESLRAGAGSPQYDEAVGKVYRKHLCRLDPWPADVVRAFEETAWDVYEQMWGPSEFEFVGSLSTWERADRLAEIASPTLVTVGRWDEITPRCSEQIHLGVAGSKLAVFEDSAHLAFHEETDRYLGVVGSFLRSAGSGG